MQPPQQPSNRLRVVADRCEAEWSTLVAGPAGTLDAAEDRRVLAKSDVSLPR